MDRLLQLYLSSHRRFHRRQCDPAAPSLDPCRSWRNREQLNCTPPLTGTSKAEFGGHSRPVSRRGRYSDSVACSDSKKNGGERRPMKTPYIRRLSTFRTGIRTVFDG